MNKNEIHACHLIKTKKGNLYFYDRQKKTNNLTHPILFFLIQLDQQGTNPIDWFHQLPQKPFLIEPYGTFPYEDIHYYLQKYLLYKNNGYFTSINQAEKLNLSTNEKDIRKTMANAQQITFEVTDQCQLNCQYCGYGKLYNDYDARENKLMNPQTAKQILDYFTTHWNSPLNNSHQKNIYISFYGGEPLLHFPFIQEIVTYAQQLPLLHNYITFSITTNALLLHQYMDFLAEHQFNLLISLDGNEIANSYRIFKNGQPAYHSILNNILLLSEKYPDYFTKKVNFNAVLHNKNSIAEIFHFFQKTFNKKPSIGSLNTSGIKEAEKKNFHHMYAHPDESLYKSNDYQVIEKEMFIRLPHIQNVALFLERTQNTTVQHYIDLLFPHLPTKMLPTGTCIPFSKKVFVTVNGKILPCERIGHQFPLGYVTPTTIELNEEEIATQFNAFLERLRHQCVNCYNTEFCTQCIYNLDLNQPHITCNGFMNAQRYSQFLASYYDFLEQKPALFRQLVKDVIHEA